MCPITSCPEQAEVTIRSAVIGDMPELLRVYEAARAFMRAHNNPSQWGNNNPPACELEKNIARGELYVMESKGKVHAAFAFIPGEDPTYRVIEGAWRDDSPYAAIHRVASDGELKGVFSRCAAYCKARCGHLRIDTHADNYPMQGAIQKEGFLPCGVIYLENGYPRLAFEFVSQK